MSTNRIRIYDNGGKTADQYTVFYNRNSVKGMSRDADRPNGFNMWIDAFEGPHLGEQIRLEDMSPGAQRMVKYDLDNWNRRG